MFVTAHRRPVALLAAVLLAGVSLSGSTAAATHRPGRAAAPSWKRVATPNPGQFGAYGRWLIDVSAGSAKNVWAVGFTHVGPLIVHSSGSTWKTVKSPRPREGVGSLKWVSTLRGKDAWAFGLQGSSLPQALWAIQHNKSGWHNVKLPKLPDGFRPERVRAYSDTSIWAVGSDIELSGQLPAAAHWDGDSWTELKLTRGGGATGDLADITKVPGENAWLAVGTDFSPQVAGLYVSLTTSSIDAMPATGEVYRRSPGSVVAMSSTNAWAVGVDATGEYSKTLVEHWDGDAWSIARSAKVPGKQLSSFLTGVASGARNRMVAVGFSRTRDGGTRLLAERYNGTSWTLLKPQNVKTGSTWQNQFFAITSVPGSKRLYWAVGDHGLPAPGPSGTQDDIRADHTLAERCLC